LKKASPLFIGRVLRIGKQTFGDLDELYGTYIEPLNETAQAIARFRYFRKGTKAEIDAMLAESKKKDPKRTPYFISISEDHKGYYAISFMPNSTAKHIYFSIIPGKLVLRGMEFTDVDDLIAYFKKHSEELLKPPPKPTKPQNPILQNHMRRFSFDSIFRTFELSKFRSNHLLTDASHSSNSSNNSNSNNSINKHSNKGEKMNHGISLFNSFTNASNTNSGISIQEINDHGEAIPNEESKPNTNIHTNANSNTNSNISINNTSFFMPNPTHFGNTMLPINSTSNKEFNNLIKNFHLASPITPLIANINLNNAINEVSHTHSKSKGHKDSKNKSVTSPPDTQKSVFSLKNKPLFSNSKKIQLPDKMDLSLIYNNKDGKNDTHDTATSGPIYTQEPIVDPSTVDGENQNANSNGFPAAGSELLTLLREKQNQAYGINDENENGNGNGNGNGNDNGNMEELHSNYNGIFTSTVNGSSILSSNVIMNNQVMLDQYRNTLNHYSNSGSAILQVLIDSWLRFLNGFVGYGSNVNYDINNMNYNNNGSSKFYTPDSSRSSFTEESFNPTDPTSYGSSPPTSSQNIKALSTIHKN